MNSGELKCPSCQNPGMSDYAYYDSIGDKHWFFYNTQTQFNQWKCWALLESCGTYPKHWYDPCGWCFDPCDHTPDIVTKVNGVQVSRQIDYATGFCCCFFFLIVCEIIYVMYCSIFFWYDLYYYFCKGTTTNKVIFIGNGERVVPSNSYYWTNVDPNFFTEKYWVDNFPNLFHCTRCNYQGKSFKEFMPNNQLANFLAHEPTSVTNVALNN